MKGKAMISIGCHLSVSKGFMAMGRDALAIAANTFQFFTRNPRGSKAKDIDHADIAAFLQFAAEHRFAPLLAHAPYTLNPCSADPKTREFALATMQDDLARLELLPGNLYNFHPGSHVGQGEAAGIALITAQLNAVLTPHQNDDRPARNHGRQGQRGRPQLSGTAPHPRWGRPAGQDGDLSRHLSRP